MSETCNPDMFNWCQTHQCNIEECPTDPELLIRLEEKEQRIAECLAACTSITFNGDSTGAVKQAIEALRKLSELIFSRPATEEARKHYWKVYQDAISRVEVKAE